MKVVVSISLLLICAVSMMPQSKNASAIRQINRYVESVDKITSRKKEPSIVVADVSDYNRRKLKWRVFRSTKELEKFRESTETYSIAYNWQRESKIVASVFTFFSPSGDWVRYVRHLFRSDGSVAKVVSELRTFYGDFIVIREMYFDSRGKALKRSTKYLDLTTRKPKKPIAELLDDNSVLSRNEYYKKVSALPFYSLVKTKL